MEGSVSKPTSTTVPVQEVGVGAPVKVGDIVWTVDEAILTDTVVSEHLDPAHPVDGATFVVIRLTFANEGSEPCSFSDKWTFELRNGEGRRHAVWDMRHFYLPEGTTDEVNPGLSGQNQTIFEVPASAENFTLVVRDVSRDEDGAYVDLGF